MREAVCKPLQGGWQGNCLPIKVPSMVGEGGGEEEKASAGARKGKEGAGWQGHSRRWRHAYYNTRQKLEKRKENKKKKSVELVGLKCCEF